MPENESDNYQKKYGKVTETAFTLFDAAEGDIIDIDLKIRKQRPLNQVYDKICYQSSQAAEKFIKGFIRYNNSDVFRTHELIPSLEIAIEINNSFKDIIESCSVLNNYGSKFRYSEHDIVNINEISDCIKALKSIYNFEPIKKIRMEYIKSGKYRIKKDIKLNDKTISRIFFWSKDRNDIFNKEKKPRT